jgi:hypothetical protein
MQVFVSTLAMRTLAMGPLVDLLRLQASIARPTNRPNHHVNGSWVVVSLVDLSALLSYSFSPGSAAPGTGLQSLFI